MKAKPRNLAAEPSSTSRPTVSQVKSSEVESVTQDQKVSADHVLARLSIPHHLDVVDFAEFFEVGLNHFEGRVEGHVPHVDLRFGLLRGDVRRRRVFGFLRAFHPEPAAVEVLPAHGHRRLGGGFSRIVDEGVGPLGPARDQADVHDLAEVRKDRPHHLRVDRRRQVRHVHRREPRRRALDVAAHHPRTEPEPQAKQERRSNNTLAPRRRGDAAQVRRGSCCLLFARRNLRRRRTKGARTSLRSDEAGGYAADAAVRGECSCAECGGAKLDDEDAGMVRPRDHGDVHCGVHAQVQPREVREACARGVEDGVQGGGPERRDRCGVSRRLRVARGGMRRDRLVPLDDGGRRGSAVVCAVAQGHPHRGRDLRGPRGDGGTWREAQVEIWRSNGRRARLGRSGRRRDGVSDVDGRRKRRRLRRGRGPH
mmetsp:Transcript_4270/g.14136  ORF Transcript_4270/g.14136 Transcript_4270/m.14136 type:complete len:424 (+) Transcript_4270:182-1453(+)